MPLGPLESTITRNIMNLLKKLPKCKAVKFPGGAGAQVGTPDILACYRGQFIALEVKRVGNEPTPIQCVQLLQWQGAEGMAVVVRSVEDVKQVITEIDNQLFRLYK